MDYKSIKNSIQEILRLSEGKDVLMEMPARNFSYTEGPTLTFMSSEDGDIDYYPDFSTSYKPSYVPSEHHYFPSSLNETFACIAVEFGYYDGIRYYICKNDEINELVYNEAEAVDNPEEDGWLYSYNDKENLSEKDMYDYMKKLVEEEYYKGHDVLLKMHQEYGGELEGISKTLTTEPQSDGSDYDFDDEITKIVDSAKLN